MFTVYHAPQLRKVGCTSRWPARALEQDLNLDEVEVKFVSNNIEEASLAEEELRKFYGYKPDSNMTYVQKFSSHALNGVIKKVSSTPSVGWNELGKGATKDELLADMNKYKSVVLGAAGEQFVFQPYQYVDLVKKAKSSQYKDFYWQITTLKKMNDENLRSGDNGKSPCTHGNTIPEFQQIRDWATERGLYEKGDAKTQYLKLQEEAGEVARAILKSDEAEIIDGLGDTLVVLINLAHLAGYKLEDCLASAYDVISKRTGKMVNGTFVKTESL